MYRKPSHQITPKAQTQLDFVIGIGIFLVAFSVVIVGAGSLLQPFQTGQENIAATDRIADKLTNTLLTTGDKQYVLDKDCTVTFFDSLRNDAAIIPQDKCRFDQISPNEKLEDVFGVPSTYYINISIVNATTGNVITKDGVKLTAGNLPDTRTITTSKRLVRIDNKVYYAYVRVVA